MDQINREILLGETGDWRSRLTKTVACVATAACVAPMLAGDSVSSRGSKADYQVSQTEAYQPKQFLETAVLVVSPEMPDKRTDNVESRVELEIINDGLKLANETLGPYSMQFTPVDEAREVTLDQKAVDETGRACYGNNQHFEALEQVRSEHLANQYVVVPAPGYSFCNSGEMAAGGAAWANPSHQLVTFLNNDVGANTLVHELAHLKGVNHHTKLDCPENLKEFTSQPKDVSEILNQCEPFLTDEGKIDMYKSDKSVQGHMPVIEEGRPVLNTFQRAAVHSVYPNNEALYQVVSLDKQKVFNSDGLYRLRPHNKEADNSEESVQVVQVYLDNDHPLKNNVNDKIDRLAITLDYVDHGDNRDLMDDGWFSCDGKDTCSISIAAVDTDNNLYDLPTTSQASYVHISENGGNERAWGSVSYVDQSLGLAVLNSQVMKLSDDGEDINRAYAIKLIKIDELNESDMILKEMSGKLLEDL